MTPKSIKYKMSDISFRTLRRKHSSVITSFQTYNQDLRDFLIEDALRRQELAISTTFLLFPKRESKLLGYITLLNDAIPLDVSLKNIFREKGITHKALPALKIGRLCIDERFERCGAGKAAFAFAVKRAVFMNQTSACRFITVDAKRHEDKEKDSFHFYKRFGFEILKESRKTRDVWHQTSGTTPMYLDLYHIICKTLKAYKTQNPKYKY